ncbi:hypothetical protein MP228_009486 [Amoeboaphelidium protococcarum]|nr:hypothetical protein MP228_009486 [Amoeboaphelidium protococcarum]
MKVTFALLSALAVCFANQELHQSVNELSKFVEMLAPSLAASSAAATTSSISEKKPVEFCWKKFDLPKFPPRRNAFDSASVCPSNQLQVQTQGDSSDLCITASCPPSLPYACGIACTVSHDTCTKEAANVSLAIFQVIEYIQNQNWTGALITAQRLVSKLRGWPLCDDLLSSADQDTGVIIQNVIQMIKDQMTFTKN